MDTILLDVFDTLNKSGVNYCLLRGYDELEQNERLKEIDLLITPDHLPQFTNLLATKRFATIPSWGYAPHHFFISYHQETDTWVKFDVVTDLRYGRPIRALSINMAKRCLRNRRWRAPTYVLSPEDEFITLVLHCLLDKEDIHAKHRVRLAELRCEVANDQDTSARLVEHVERLLAPAITWESLDKAVKVQDWPGLVNRKAAIARQLFWQHPASVIRHCLSGMVLRRLRPLHYALQRRGFAVALLAPDGAGKSTLALSLARDPHLRARWIYAGTNVDAYGIGLPSSRWLHKRLKSLHKTPGRMPLYWNALKALNLSNRLVEQWYRLGVAAFHKLRGRFVVFDRYVYDSWLLMPPVTPWKRLRRWLLEAGWPKPALVILLDAHGTLLYQRKGEHTPQWLEQQRCAYLRLKERIPQMIVIDATREADAVRREVISLIWTKYQAHVDKNNFPHQT